MTPCTVLVFCCLFANGVSVMADTAQTNTPKRFLSTAEVLKIVEQSDTLYNITFTLKGLMDVNSTSTADRLFPLSVRPIEYPWRMQKEDGSTEIVEFPFSPEAWKMIEEAEAHFKSKRYSQAMTCYRSIIDRFPDCYLAYTHLGDAYFMTKQYQKAVEYFDKSIEINPLDHRVFFYKADALMSLGRHDEAKEAYIHSLSLRPQYPFALAALQYHAGTLGIEVRTDLFQPQAIVKPEKDKAVAVYVAKEPHPALWLSYAATKAIWLGEPSHRQEMTGNSTYGWSALEEMESLLNLAETYQSLKQEGKIPADSRLELLGEIIEAKDLDAFVHYEIAARMCPHIMLTFPEEARQSMREFIVKYVVVSLPTQPAEGADRRVATAAAFARPVDKQVSQ